MEHLSQDAVRTFFSLRLAQLEGFESSDLTEPELLEASAWLEEPEARSMFAWIEQGETKRLVQATLSRTAASESRIEDRLPAPIRTGAVKEFCYFFKREDDQPITSSNLNEQILFGCSRGPLLDSLLSQMNNIYVPVALADHGWPDNVRKEFTSQVQNFMLTVTAMTHQGKGSTVLYIPQDNFANLEAASKDKDIVQRCLTLRSSKAVQDIVHLTLTVKRLKVALIHWHRQIKEDSANEGENNGPLDEIEFWNARDKILNFKRFENLRFLNFLKEPCEKLAEATPPEIPAILPELLNYVRSMAASREGSIFLQIDAFVQRCCDLLEVCQGLQQFACRFRGQAMPAFGGTKAGEISNSLNEIEDNFLKNLQRLQPPFVDYDILDVRAPKWPDHFGAFKNQMRDLEARHFQVINSAFEGVGTVQTACQVLDSFYQLAQRERVKAFVEKKGETLYNIFLSELNHNIKKEFDQFRKLPSLPIIQGHPQYAGPALAVRGLMLRIQQQMAELDQLCYLEWCREQENCRDTFNTLHGNMETFVLTNFQDWVQELKGMDDQNLPKRLQVNLLVKPEETVSSKFKGGLLECNFDKELLKMFQEVCKKLSELHMIKIEKKTVHRDDEFRDVQERPAEQGFLERRREEVKAEFNKVDKSIKESLKKESKMDFKPPMAQLKDLLQMVCRDMTMTLSVVPRLAEHLYAVKTERDRIKKQQLEEAGDLAGANAIPPPGDPPKKKKGFFEEISKDEDCCLKYVKEVLRGFNHCAMRLGERLKFWNSSYQPIVSSDKDTFIRRYKKTERSLTIVGQDIQRYKDVQSDIQQEEPKAPTQWPNRLLEYFDSNTKTFHSEISDMDELKNRIALLEQCRKDDAEMENKIKPIEDARPVLHETLGFGSEVVPSDEELQRKAQMRPQMETFRETLVEAEIRISKSKKQMKAGLEQDLGSFGQSIRDVKTDFGRHAPYKSEGLTPETAASMLQNYRNQIEAKRKLEAEFRPKQELFGIEPANYKELEWVEQEIEKLTMVWDIRDGWNKEWDKLRSGSFQSLNTDDMDELAMQFLGKLRKVIGKDKNVQNWQVYQDLKSDLEVFRNMMPVITHLRSDAMRERHIEAIVKEVKEAFNPKDAGFTLQRVMDLGLQKHADLIARLCDDAKKEAKIENGLEDIARIWSTMTIDVVEHKGDAFKVRSTEELYQALDENIQALSSYKSSPFYLPFAPKVEYWEKTLAHISEVTESIQSVQKSWMYLENVFRGSEDIRPHLPDESIMFDDVNEGFINMMRKVYQEPLATKACTQPKMLENLQSFEASLENIQKKLNDYLEKKRQFFPRFYFISNDDLLEILGQARDPEQVQKHVKKCFEGVKSLELQPPAQNRRWEAVGLNAPDGEREKLVAPVKLEGPVEVWLGLVEKRMFESLKAHLVKCHNMNINPKAMKKEKWVKEFLGQLLITSGQIAWTTDCAAALGKVEKGQKNALRMLKRTQSKYISKLCEMIRKPLTKIERNKLVALITIEVHARDVQDRMINLKTESPSNFNWTSQLRFELRDSQEDSSGGQPVQTCVVLQTNTTAPYGYEYQGNNGRLVVTPMTDRCYMTLTTAMHLKRGGAPAGPAGTGKTESVKDLGKGMAMYVIVFNCSDGLDYKSLGRMFSGLAQCGCWGCFDEFNRIDVSVLSVVAVQIMTIQNALKEEKDKFLFEDLKRSRLSTKLVFITMNPGYAGRSELPDNLKALFRPVAMMVPDLAMIMEIMLVSEGFKDFKMLAKKKFTLYQMMLQQMSKQHHYDFGLRNIKSVLGCAGALKRKEPDMPEQILLMRAINDMNAPKWVSQDVPLYQALLSDIFPGVELPVPDYGKLEEVINQVLEEMGCQKVKHSVAKCISIYETKITRHGNMLVGGTLGGKSVCWKTLAKAKCILKSMGQEGMEKVIFDIINPKSITMNELYGAYDAATMMEWTDGVLSSIMRRMCQDEKPDEKWLVLDGPVDTLWIESMNTVLDDNKVLTLINGDRISMPPMVRLLFEVADLAQASPATVSRAGMVYFDPPDLGWEPYFKSWVENFIPANRQTDVMNLAEKWIPKCLKIRKNCVELAPIVDTNAVMSLTRLYETFAPKIDIESFGEKTLEALDKLFAFSLIWSLGASITEASRPTFDQCVREVENYFPASQSIYDYAFNFEKADFAPWDEKLPNPFRPEEGTPFHKIVVPTTDTIRNLFILKSLNSKHFHSLLVGCTGTGKTIAVQEAIAGLEETSWTSLTINMSAMTSSGKTQEIIESKIEKRIKNKFGPAGNKRMLMFVDDLNMPRKDTFGSQPPLELLRQWIDYGCWYDRQKQTLRYAEGIHMVSAMGPPGGGRAVISSRLQSAANNLCFVNPADSQIKRIFMTLASNKLNTFQSEEIKALSEPLTMTTINIYTQVIDGFLPTPEKCHYLFNLRDIAKIFQGIYLADTKAQLQDREKFRSLLDAAMDNGLQVRQKESHGKFQMELAGRIDGGDPDFVFASLDLTNPEAEDAVYDYMQDRNGDSGLKRFMESRNEDYNAMFKKSPMSLVMFKEAVEICCKVLRILKQPQGLTCKGHFGQEDTDTEIVEESFLEDVANMLSSGEVPNLFTGDELSTVRASLEKAGKEAKIAQTPEAMYDFFISRVRENLHIVFCMSYIGNNFRDYCRMYPSLVSCTTAIWLLPWPAEALTEVALKFLTEGELEEHLRPPVAEIFGAAHTTVMRFSTRIYQEQKRMNYVTPTNYLELVQGYMKMLKDKQKELGAAADKLRNGLSKLDDARVQVAEMSVDLEEKQKICDVKAKECEELLKVITAERSKADAQQAQVEADSIRIEKEAKETKILADDATRDLEKAMPALDAAVDALEKLDKKSIAEVKAYPKPPDAVMKTMCAVMTVMEKTPSWGQAKTELNDTNFLVRIKNFDKDNIKDTTLRKIEKFTKDSNFTPKLVSNVSLAAGALCQWVHAMKIYAEIYREVEPKRNKLRQAQEKLESKQKQLREANAELKKVQDLVKGLNDQFNSSNNEKETLARTAEELKVKLERAGKLVDGLAGEKVRWTESLGKFDAQQENLFGDCLVSAAFMSYAGPFGAAYRDELVEHEWMASVKEKEVPFTSSYTFASFLAKPTEVREWNLQKLPADDFSTENGVLVTKSRRFPLMIDPQSQANTWVRKMEESRQLKVFDPNSKDIMKSLERAIEFGTPVLLENVGEELDPSLEPILAKNVIDNGGGTLSLKVGDNVLDYNPAFMFYITTKLSNPHYTPEVSTKTTIVNFIVVLDGLTNQLLGVIVRCEDKRLEEDKNQLLFQVAKGRNRLVELENEILRLLAETKGSLLDDLSLIDTLQESKVISIQTTEQVAHAEQNMVKIDGQRENYRPAGLRSAVLYFVLNDLVAIDPMYQFALAAYEILYIQSIEKSAEKKISVGGKRAGVEERIEDLNAFHALAVYKYGCRAIFERHKLLLSLHLCAQVLKYSNDLNETEFSFFLFGGQVFDRSGQSPNPSPDWINQSMWDNIIEADSKLESFKGFQTSLEQSLRDWKKWYSGSEPEKDNLPGEWHERLDPLQKLIVVRCIRPDRVLPAVQVFVALKLDSKFVEPPPLDLEAIYDETSCLTPLLFVLTPGMDPTGQLRALAVSRNVAWQTISLGQGQEPIRGGTFRKAEKMMPPAENLIGLADSHLCVHWLPALEKLIERTFDQGPHEKFRIFMSSSPTPKFPIQLLQNCIKMTTEPPKGLKANLVRLLQNTSEDSYNRVKETQKYRRLFFSLCWFHAVLLERKKFKMLGWNIGYDFNDSDFDICENILAMYLDENPTEIPWDAIRYLIAEANYGGRVTEHPDNRVLRSYVNEFFCTAALQPKFQLSTLNTYYIPEDGSLHSYRQYVQSLPLSEPPEAFGQHTNAEISSSLADTDILMQTMIEVRGGGGSAAGGDIGETVYATCNTLLEKLPAARQRNSE
ncbi:Dynein axonemal heavy chain 2 (Axonemal beta dynein heavy chain 2) (Ciliary dynein heavy chain 2) [Durusdinium trenchii]|uniref:Dynein axonemal heavy chain 2 (Axonemal beta dynein heavy chain 2) (Ciliary dynein heavy chain 2) n=1 Tax=Durusdinium trenchii TaxID=1381693 RepID=A0ABP0MVG4_9DINO